MLTVWGVILTVIGAAGVGGCICRDQRRRSEELFLLEKFLMLAAGEVSYGRTGMPALFGEVGERIGKEFGSTLSVIGQRMNGERGDTLEVIWKEEMSSYLKDSCLKKEEIDLFLSFPEEVGFLDRTRQQKAIENLGEEMGRRARLLRQQQKTQEKMTMALCLSGGIAVAILLL